MEKRESGGEPPSENEKRTTTSFRMMESEFLNLSKKQVFSNLESRLMEGWQELIKECTQNVKREFEGKRY